jgi:hypothetical protein
MNKLVNKFNNIIEESQYVLDDFTEGFAKDPAYALSWGNGAFKAAARIRVAKELAKAFENENAEVLKVRAYLTDRVVGRAKYPPQSTSPTANLMEQYEVAAYAEALEILNYE